MTQEKLFHEAGSLIRRANSPVIFTGAGVSQESGIPTFRDALTGFWANYQAESLATPEAFRANPKLVWDFYEYRRTLIRKCVPNAAHHAIAGLEERASNVVVITQNVDGFHQQAGSRDVIALHGNIFENRCFTECGWLAEAESVHGSGTGPATCPNCRKALIRPNVVWFGEALDDSCLARAMAAVMQCDVLVSIGTSGLVYPAAQIPFLAVQLGKPVIEINPTSTDFTPQATFHFPEKAAEFFPRLLKDC